MRFPFVAAAAHQGCPVREVKSPVLALTRISSRGTSVESEAADTRCRKSERADSNVFKTKFASRRSTSVGKVTRKCSLEMEVRRGGGEMGRRGEMETSGIRELRADRFNKISA